MDYNIHSHTNHCDHAEGNAEEYIQRAISCGMKYYGFSEHCPLIFDDGTQSHYRLKAYDIDNYVNEINGLKEKYKDIIEIKLGFEMEYYEEYFETMLNTARKCKVDYLILGQHFTEADNLATSHPSTTKTDDVKLLEKYIKAVISGMEKGVFTYVAHPDMFNFTGDEKTYIEEFRKICIASNKYTVPLEINCIGIRHKRSYPNELFWQIAGEEQCPVTIGLDAHKAHDAYDEMSILKAKEIIGKYNLNYIGRPTLKNIN